jgi:adenylate cyclase
MSSRVPAGTLRDKIVFVGTTALGTREVVATPLDTLFVGVEVQATVADNLLQQDFISRSQFGTILEGLVMLVLGVAVTWLVASTGTLSGVLGSGINIAALCAIARWVLSTTEGVFVSPNADDRRGGRWRRDPREVHGQRGRADTARARKTMRSA